MFPIAQCIKVRTHPKKSLINLVIENHVCSVYMGGSILRTMSTLFIMVTNGHHFSWKKRQSPNNPENLLILVTLYWQMTLFQNKYLDIFVLGWALRRCNRQQHLHLVRFWDLDSGFWLWVYASYVRTKFIFLKLDFFPREFSP